MPRLNGREVVAALEDLGFELVHIHGSHHQIKTTVENTGHRYHSDLIRPLALCLLLVLSLASCAEGKTTRLEASITTVPMVDSSLTPTSTAEPLDDHEPTSAQTAKPTLAPTLAIVPTPLSCETGLVAFLLKGRGERNGIYLACSDGSNGQQVVSEGTALPDSWHITHMDASPDGKQIAFSANSGLGDEGSIYSLNLLDYSLVEVYAGSDTILELSWSADGEYIGYVRDTPSCFHLEAVHTGTGTVSRLLDGELENTENYVFRPLGPVWSPDGTQILYMVELLYFTEPRVETTGRLANVNCISHKHTCKFDAQTTLDWVEFDDRLFWSPEAPPSIVRADIDVDSNVAVVEFRGVDGALNQQITIDGLSLGIEFSVYSDFALSPNGERIAFTATPKGAGSERVFVLNLDDMTVVSLGRSGVTQIEWIP